MSIHNSEIHEGVMLQEEFVSIPVSVFEDLIRAETERDILENILTGEFAKAYFIDGSIDVPHGSVGAFMILPLYDAYELTGDKKYAVDDVLKAIQTARAKHHRGTLRVEIGVCPCSCEESASDEKGAADTNAAASDMEDPADDEACE